MFFFVLCIFIFIILIIIIESDKKTAKREIFPFIIVDIE